MTGSSIITAWLAGEGNSLSYTMRLSIAHMQAEQIKLQQEFNSTQLPDNQSVMTFLLHAHSHTLTGKACPSGRPRSPLCHDRTASGTTWSRSHGWALPCGHVPMQSAGSACGHHESCPESCAAPGPLTGMPPTAYGASESLQGSLDPLSHSELQTWLRRPHPLKGARDGTLCTVRVLPECTQFPSATISVGLPQPLSHYLCHLLALHLSYNLLLSSGWNWIWLSAMANLWDRAWMIDLTLCEVSQGFVFGCVGGASFRRNRHAGQDQGLFCNLTHMVQMSYWNTNT